MKRILNILALLLMVSSLGIVTSCVSDGDETVSLEYGRVRKMIVGRWKIDKIQRGDDDDWRGFRIRDWEPGTTLVFYDDGTYKDSSDKGDGRMHRWRLKGRDYDDEPYYGGIILDDDEFDFDSFGPGRWILRWPSGYDDDDDNPGWRIGLDKESDDPEDEPDPEPDPDPEQEYEYHYLVSKITRSETGYYNDKSEWTFQYDDKERITEFSGNLAGWTYQYVDDIGVVNVDLGYGRYCQGELDDDGKLTSVVVTNQGVKQTYNLSYNGMNRLNAITIPLGNTYKVALEASWDSDILNSAKYSLDKFYFTYYFEEKNDANIDLNAFILDLNYLDRWAFGDMIVFTPFGFYGMWSANLMTSWYEVDLVDEKCSVHRNEHGLIDRVEIVYERDNGLTDIVLHVEYEERAIQIN